LPALLFLLLAAPPSVVVDGDFERPDLVFGVGASPGGWKVLAPNAPLLSAIQLVVGEGINGSRCAAYRRAEAENANIHLDQVLEVRPETIYLVTAKVRGDGRLRPLLTVAAMTWGQMAITAVEPSTEWQTVRLYFSSQMHHQVRLEWFGGATGELYSGVAGTAYLDDVSVVPVDNPSPALQRAFSLARPQPELARPKAAGAVGEPLPLRRIVCRDGVLQYEDGGEVSLWGLNMQTALSWEWRGRLQPLEIPQTAEALNGIFDQNADHFGPLGVGVVRAHLLPGDFTDGEGHLVDTPYLDALDHMIAECSRRGVYIYLTLMNEMGGNEFCADSFMNTHRETWLFDEPFIARSRTYVDALLRHTNRYTGRTYADEPALGIIEIMNEPRYLGLPDLSAEGVPPAIGERFRAWLNANDLADAPSIGFAAWRYEQVLAYLQAMHATIRGAGAQQPVIWNCNWSRFIQGQEDVFQAVADSPIEGVSVCAYPGQGDVKSPFWANPADLNGRNYLPHLQQMYDDYAYLGWLLTDRFAGKAKCVYEFEVMYQQHRYLYPAMARMFRALGVQVAPMWEYTLSPVAEYHSGSHYLNLECTPSKAVSFRIASEVFRHTPRLAPFKVGGETMAEGAWKLSFPEDASFYQGDGLLIQTTGETSGDVPAGIREILGCGSSPAVTWSGTGYYQVLVGDDALTIRIGPDVEPLREPWMRPTRERKLSVKLDRDTAHRFELRLPGWGGPCVVTKDGELVQNAAAGIGFAAKAGMYRVRRG